MSPPPTSSHEHDSSHEDDRALAIVKSIPDIVNAAKELGLDDEGRQLCHKVKVTINIDQKMQNPCRRGNNLRCNEENPLFEVDFQNRVGCSLFTLEAAALVRKKD